MMHNVTWQPGMTLEQLERAVIEDALVFYRGNRAATARSLGISDRTIDNKLEAYAKADAERKVLEEQRKKDAEADLARQRGDIGSPFYTPQAVSKNPIKVPLEMREPHHEKPAQAEQSPAPAAQPAGKPAPQKTRARVPVHNSKKK